MKHLAILVVLLINCQATIASEALYRMTQKGSVACLARAVYQEANTQGGRGREAVMAVIVNRAVEQQRHVCEIIKQPSQFSWVKHDTNVAKLTGSKDAERFVLNVVAKTARTGYNSFRGVKYFFAHRKGKPVWANKMVCSRIEDHTFCGEKR